ncbi:Uncharacterized protein FKW44_009571 [Caligus rogercresseyi]|nr:Uncharacterized protein FKW44_009571 [Caligus rogercresseyi]
MKLARDTPREFYYAPTPSGGLALMELEVRRKLIQNKRISALRESRDPIVQAIIAQDPLYVRPQKATVGGLLCKDKDTADTLYAKALWAKTDTCGLASTAQGHRNFMFMRERGQKLTDATFCAAVQMMAGAPLTKAKRARFTQLPNGNKCESCADRVKNLQHILQVCPRVRGARIKRHDQVQALLEKSLKAKQRTYHRDNVIPMGGTVRKPDLVIIDKDKISVVDPTIVSDTLSLQESENSKAATYNTTEFKKALLRYFECEESHTIEQIEVVPIVINWRGIMSERTYRALVGTVGMTPQYVKYVQLKVLTASHMIYREERDRPDRDV